MLELMMYRAFFELSPNRAAFLSHLFARKQPQGLTEKSSPDELFAAFHNVQPDPLLFNQNVDEIKDVLVKQHKFALTDEDIANIGYVYRVFMEAGPDLDYQIGGGGFGGGGSPTYMDLMTMNDGQGSNRSFLGAEENYRMIRDMEMKNLIVPLVGDFAGPHALRAIGEYLKEHDATVSAFYVSNVEQYLFQDEGWRKFYANIAALPLDASSQFIRSVNGGNIRGRFTGGFGMRFQTLLSPIGDVVKAFQDGRINYYGDVISMSHP